MTPLLQELGPYSTSVAGLSVALVGGWMLWMCGSELAQAVRGRIVRYTRAPRLCYRQAIAAQREGQVERAFFLLSRVLKHQSAHYEAALAMWDAAREAGHPRRAEKAMLRAIRLDIERGDREAALRHWNELQARGCEIPVDAELKIQIAGLLQGAGRRREALAVLGDALEGSDGPDGAHVAHRVARAAIDLDRDLAEEAAWCALGSVQLTPERRGDLEALIARLYPSDAGRPALELGVAHEADPVASAAGAARA